MAILLVSRAKDVVAIANDTDSILMQTAVMSFAALTKEGLGVSVIASAVLPSPGRVCQFLVLSECRLERSLIREVFLTHAL